MSWSPDNTKLLTAGADKCAKLWDAATGACIQTFEFPNDVDHIQVGTVWQKEHMITLSLNGELNYLDMQNSKCPKRIVRGHTKFVTALAMDKKTNNMISGSYDCTVFPWNIENGLAAPMNGSKPHSSIVNMDVRSGKMLTWSVDGSLATSNLETQQWGYYSGCFGSCLVLLLSWSLDLSGVHSIIMTLIASP